MATTLIVIGIISILSFVILSLFVAFDSEEEPLWHREEADIWPIQKEPVLPAQEEVMEAVETNFVAAQSQCSTMCKPEVMLGVAKAVGRQRVA